MIKKLGIAAVCGIALYGFARFINGRFVLVLNGSVPLPLGALDGVTHGSETMDGGAQRGNVTSAAAMDQSSGTVVGAECVDCGVEVAGEKPSDSDREAPCL